MKTKVKKIEEPKQEPVKYTGYYVVAHFAYDCGPVVINYDEDFFFKDRLSAERYYNNIFRHYQKALEEDKLVWFERVALIPVRMGDDVLDYIH